MLSEVLSGFDHVNDTITDFLRVTDDGTDSFVAVDIDRSANGTNFVHIATIEGVTSLTDEAALVANGDFVV